MSRKHFEHDVCLVKYQEPRCSLLALREIEKLDELKHGIFYPHAERISRRLRELQNPIMRGEV